MNSTFISIILLAMRRDLVFSNMSGTFVSVAYDPLLDCDKYHLALRTFVLPLSIKLPVQRSLVRKRNFKCASFAAINKYLNTVSWDVELRNRCAEDAVGFLYMHLDYVISSFVPKYTCA